MRLKSYLENTVKISNIRAIFSYISNTTCRYSLLISFFLLFEGCYLKDVFKYNAPDIDDYKIFANALIPKGDSVNFLFTEEVDTTIGKIHVIPSGRSYKSKKECQSLESYIQNSTTIAFMAIRNDTILYENYSKGFNKNDRYYSFSMMKSLGVFPLIGIAIKEGLIKSVDDPISDYFPELKPAKKFKKITLRHLLNMNAGIIDSRLAYVPWSSQFRYYYGYHLEKELDRLKISLPPGKAYRYSVGANTQLLAFLLERVTGKTIDTYFYEKIWSKIGPEADALWSKDREGGNVKSFGFFLANIRDYARIGKLFMDEGVWKGEQIIPKEWIAEITSPKNIRKKSTRYFFTARNRDRDYMAMHWWVGTKGRNEFKASGFFGQQLYIFPEENTMIITFRDRNGLKDPEYEVDLFYQILDGIEAIK